ncbi:sugar epimerase [Niabella ginsenosidivorans]|uniref:Sugar epimerase n=1 Tax=Niabella ginsenosidivorans TaxID=1176587 RepID=A0A1A9HXB8_9BACT|nr:WxcM-like domain-containing protein [Niabella ginsenosidivorans]ANH79725.1 sugar epimerase [Niabella ginsenosidivorans]
MKPVFIKGGTHIDERGTLLFNNSFDATSVKRIYTIEHTSTSFIRGWMGHEVEHRWFTVLQGCFKIDVLAITDWQQPDLRPEKAVTFILEAESLDVLHIPPGHLFSLQAKESPSRILVMADRLLGADNDEHRYPAEAGRV